VKLVSGVLLLAFAAASPEIRYFEYERPIRNITQRSAQTCLVLDAGIFAHAAPQLADLRLYHDRTETPYVIRLAAPRQDAEQSITPLNLGLRGGQSVFDAAMPEGRYSDLQLAVNAQDFIATVTVSGSQAQTGSTGTKLGSYTIFDLTRQKLGRSTVLHLPESDFRYLHFRITGLVPPESVTGLSVGRLPASKPKYQTVAESSTITQKGHSSVLEFTLPAHVPVDRIAFTPGAEPVNFSRDVIISAAPASELPVTNAALPPQPGMSSGNLLRIHSMQNGHRIDEERFEIDAPSVDLGVSTKWTITIENGDDAPLMLKSVVLQMLERNLCFEAAGQAHYVLFYGDPALPPPRYDYSRLFTLQADASQAATGPEQQNPEYQSRPDERPFTEKHPALLWTALIVVIVLLGAIALRSAKQATTSK
jgi:Protein of unknown function (DUF3999)